DCWDHRNVACFPWNTTRKAMLARTSCVSRGTSRFGLLVGGDDHPAVRFLTLAEAGDAGNLPHGIVDDLAFKGVHGLELHLAFVDRPSRHLPCPLPKRFLPALPVA